MYKKYHIVTKWLQNDYKNEENSYRMITKVKKDEKIRKLWEIKPKAWALGSFSSGREKAVLPTIVGKIQIKKTDTGKTHICFSVEELEKKMWEKSNFPIHNYIPKGKKCLEIWKKGFTVRNN